MIPLCGRALRVRRLFSLDYPVIVRPPGRGLRLRAVGVAEDAVADADPVALDAPLLQQGLALRHLKYLPRAVYPAGAEAEGVRRVEQVTHDQRGVLHAVHVPRLGEDDDDRRRAEEGIEVRTPPDGGVQAAHERDVLRVLHGHDERRLRAAGRGCIGPGLEHGAELLVRYLLRLVLPDAAAGQEILHGFVHTCTSVLKFCLSPLYTSRGALATRR